MSMEFGWLSKDDEGKYQIHVCIHGGNVEWTRKNGHWQSWDKYPPNEDDWDKLMGEAARRVPRRLISPKQYDALKVLRDSFSGNHTTPKKGHKIKE